MIINKLINKYMFKFIGNYIYEMKMDALYVYIVQAIYP